MNCNSCKYFVPKSQLCILGRRTEFCTGHPARRGDDELIERVGKIANQLDEDFLKKFASEK